MIKWYFFLNGRNCQDSRTWTPGNKAIDHRELQDNWGSAFHCGFPLGRAVNQFLKTLLHRYRTEVWPSLLSSRSLSAFSSPSSPGIKLFASASSTTSTRLKLPSVWLMEFRKKKTSCPSSWPQVNNQAWINLSSPIVNNEKKQLDIHWLWTSIQLP